MGKYMHGIAELLLHVFITGCLSVGYVMTSLWHEFCHILGKKY